MDDKDLPSMEEVMGTVFTAPDKSFSVTVPELDHALNHYDEMVALVWRAEDPRAAKNGLMAACLAHALGWTADTGMEQLQSNVHFQTLISVAQDIYLDCKVSGLFRSDQANLS